MDFPDTSFLCSFYRQQVFTPLAFDYMDKLDQPLSVSSLLLFEFHNSLRLQQRLFKNDRTRGFSRNEAEGMFRGLQSDLRTGLLQLVIVDWTDVHGIAEELSGKHTLERGHRFADMLHVATALHLGSGGFLSFDDNQRALAMAEGMEIPM